MNLNAKNPISYSHSTLTSLFDIVAVDLDQHQSTNRSAFCDVCYKSLKRFDLSNLISLKPPDC